MIYKIKKNLTEGQEDYAIVSGIGELLCKVAVMSNGYYLYNKVGAQIAQVKIEGNQSFMAIARQKPAWPATAILTKIAQDKFDISYLMPTPAEKEALETLEQKDIANYTIWGKPSEYNYDLYYGSTKCANIVPSSTNQELYSINILDVGNALHIIMIALSAELFSK